VSAKSLPQPDQPLNVDEVRKLIRKAEAGNSRCLPALRKVLETYPKLGRSYDLAANLRDDLAGKLCGRHLYTRELLMRQVDELLASVVGANASPIERLLGERVVMGWLQMQQADMDVSDRPSDLDVRVADAAHRRYFAALKALTDYRKLPRPAVQVNIGEQQVNVSG
jgi:hypothetical protein